jgi:hypothetical protein
MDQESNVGCGLCADSDKLRVPTAAGILIRAAGNKCNIRDCAVGTDYLYIILTN